MSRSSAVPPRSTWPAYLTCLCALAYAGMKIAYAVQGRAGLPGLPSPDTAYDAVALRQLGLVAVDLVAAAIALATVRPWGRPIPRTPLLAAAWLLCAIVAAGVIVALFHALRLTDASQRDPTGLPGALIAAFLLVWAVLSGTTALSYQRRIAEDHLW